MAFKIFGNLLSAGIGWLLNAHPVMAPSELPDSLAMVSGVELNCCRIACLMPG